MVHLDEKDAGELEELRVAVGSPSTITEKCLFSMAKSLIIIKGKVSRKWR